MLDLATISDRFAVVYGTAGSVNVATGLHLLTEQAVENRFALPRGMAAGSIASRIAGGCALMAGFFSGHCGLLTEGHVRIPSGRKISMCLVTAAAVLSNSTQAFPWSPFSVKAKETTVFRAAPTVARPFRGHDVP